VAQILLDTDTFTDTNGTLLTAHVEGSGTWGNSHNLDGAIQSNAVRTRTANEPIHNLRSGPTWTNDQWAQFTFVAFPDYHAGIVLRGQTSPDDSYYFVGYWQSVDATKVIIIRLDAGSPTVLKTTSVAITSTSTLNAQIVGTVITATIGGSSDTYDTVGDGTKYATGLPGFQVYDLTTADVIVFDSWTAGSCGGLNPVLRHLYIPGSISTLIQGGY
jgi:hypothetical protein